MSSAGDFVDFGNLTPEDVQRILREYEERGYKRFSLDEETLKGAGSVAGGFLLFVRSVLEGLGVLETAQIFGLPIGATMEFRTDEPLESMMRKLWNARAKNWTIVESPLNYAVTFQTIFEFFKVNDQQKKETILSLGSGPGLYETYLGALLATLPRPKVKIYCADFAREMTACHRKILAQSTTREGERVRNVQPLTDDMLHLQFGKESVDQVICNNALQWATDWRKAIAEMARVMRPQGLGRIYLFVHPHPMAVFDLQGNRVAEFGKFELPELLDELEAHRFVIDYIRHIAGRTGTGQAGLPTRRVFILARFQATGERRHWREAQAATALTSISVGS